MSETDSSRDLPPTTDTASTGEVASANRPSADKVFPQPVRPDERLQAVDVLRGVALLGILTMNIVAFGWPFAGYENPRFSGGDDPANVVAWFTNTVVFSGKMMTLFSMLFGAGLVLFWDRAAARGSSVAGTYYRRVLWLLVIGLVHAYLIWAGDILVMYALCGLLLYFFRRRSPRTLIILGIILLVIGVALIVGFFLLANYVADVAEQVDANIAAGRESTERQLGLHETWNEELRPFMQPSQAEVDEEIELYRGGYVEIVMGRASEVLMFQIFGLFLFMLWGAGGRMLLGMGLMKLGVFSADRSWRFYRLLALFGYGIGVPLTLIGTVQLFVHDFDAFVAPWGAMLVSLGMVPTALGHVAAVMMICKGGIGQWLTDRLAAVGRMALTNYLLQSVLCTFLFYGYGAGMFGRVDRVGLWGIVLLIWILQLIISPIWLKYYRYGPVEWLWRSLTYWRRQPIRSGGSPSTAS